MTQKDLFSKIVTGTDRGVEANISLARALTKSTESALTFTYSTESGEWSAAGELAKNNIIRYKTPNNQPIGLKDTEEFMSMKLGLQIVNPIVGDEQFDESTGEWVAKYKKEITVMGGSISTQLAYPLITKVNEAKTETIDSYITSVTLPTSVTTLDMSTLAYISGLTNLQIPYSVTSIKGNAITSCYNLTGITYPGTMAEWQGGKITVSPGWAYGTPIHVIECSDGKIYLNTINVDYTTTDGNALTLSSAPFAGPVVDNIYTSTGGTIVVGKSGSTFPIMTNAFDGQETLQSITLPSSTTSIGVDAFRLCHKLTGITIPSSVTTIGDYAFHACTGLTTFTLPNTVTSVGVGTLYACTGITDPVFNNKIFVTMRRNATGSYTVPDGIETIAGGAFQWHTGLSAITLPSTVTTIGKEAFDNCNGMEVLTVEATTPPSVTTGALLGLPADCDIYVPVGCVSAYEAAPEWSARTGHIKEMTSIQVNEIWYKTNDNAIFTPFLEDTTALNVFGANITGNTYINNHGVIIFDNPITKVSATAFQKWEDGSPDPNTRLIDVVLPSGVTQINDNSFNNCQVMTSITIPSSVTSIGFESFCLNEQLTTFNYKGTYSNWNDIDKNEFWRSNCPAATVFCVDGNTIQLPEV